MTERMIEHLSTQEQSAVSAFLQALQEHLGAQFVQAYLFGSKARGDGHPASDIDILITVKEENWPLRAQVSTLAADVSLDYSVLIGPRVIGLERWTRMQEAGFGLYKNVIAEGVPLLLPS